MSKKYLLCKFAVKSLCYVCLGHWFLPVQVLEGRWYGSKRCFFRPSNLSFNPLLSCCLLVINVVMVCLLSFSLSPAASSIGSVQMMCSGDSWTLTIYASLATCYLALSGQSGKTFTKVWDVDGVGAVGGGGLTQDDTIQTSGFTVKYKS